MPAQCLHSITVNISQAIRTRQVASWREGERAGRGEREKERNRECRVVPSPSSISMLQAGMDFLDTSVASRIRLGRHQNLKATAYKHRYLEIACIQNGHS